jgi:hypothetical protein
VTVVIGGLVVVLKLIDYGWTAWDILRDLITLLDKCSSDEEKFLAWLSITLAGILETIEPDELIGFNIPADDVWRRWVLREAREELAENGIAGAIDAVRRTAGDDVAEAVARQMDPPICFAAGTPVATAEGSASIETVIVGDLVWAVDPETGATGLFTVTDVFSHHVDSLLEVVIGEDLLHVTEEHPFWVAGEGWVGAEDLEPGDCVQTLAGTCQAVVSVQVVTADTWVYNFTVVTAHTYFVGDGQWLVHNQCQAGDFYLSVKHRKRWTDLMETWLRQDINSPALLNRPDASAWRQLSWGDKVARYREWLRGMAKWGDDLPQPAFATFRDIVDAPSSVINDFAQEFMTKFMNGEINIGPP